MSFTTFMFFFVALVVSGCESSVQKKPDTVVIGINSIPSTLDPRFALDAEGMKIGSLIFQSLIKIGPDMKVIGDAAKSWSLETSVADTTFKSESNSKNNTKTHSKKINSESSTIQNGIHNYKLKFVLHNNIKFSNGQPVICDDYLYSIDQYRSEDSPFKSAFESITKTECKDHELSISFSSYSEKILNSDLPVIKILPKSELEKSNSNFKDSLIGSGPYKISKIKDTEINLAFNPFYNPKAKIKNLQFKVIKDDFTRFLKMYRGDLDLAISSIPKNKVKSLETVKNLEVIKKPGLSMAYLLINLKNKELSRRNHRELLFEGIDRNEIIKYKLENLARPATSLLAPNNPYFWPGFLEFENKKSIDIEALRQKVLSSTISKVVLNLKTSNTREAVENAKLIATQLRKIGFRIHHESYEWGTYYKDIKQGQYDLATMTWVGAYDPDIYRVAFLSSELPPEGRNRGYYSNPEFDRLVLLGADELNTEKRKELYYKAQQMIYKDLAIIPLWYEDTITIKDRRIKNYTPSLNGDYSGLIEAHL